MNKRNLTGYESVALEYYDSARHPTSANFGYASELLLREWIRGLPRPRGWTCEVGPGRSALIRTMARDDLDLNKLVLLDRSPRMLAYSAAWFRRGARPVIADALRLPIRSACFGLVVASLGDAYNDPQFWSEVSRVLQPGGVVLFTTPSFEWAVSFRERSPEAIVTAEFEIMNKTSVLVPSAILPEERQTEAIERVGLRVASVGHVELRALDSHSVSPKLMPERGPHARVVTGYRAFKLAHGVRNGSARFSPRRARPARLTDTPAPGSNRSASTP